MSGSTSIIVREAVMNDCQVLALLMQDSAKEQQITTQSEFSAEVLKRDGFGKAPLFTICISQTQEGQVVGYLLWNYGFSAIVGRIVYVGDVFVIPSHRKKGVASTLWSQLMQTALSNGCVRCDMYTKAPNQFLLDKGAVDFTEVNGNFVFEVDREAMKTFVENYIIPNDVRIRRTERNDCLVLFENIQKLYDYLEILDTVEIDASILERDGFGERPFYRSHVAEQDGVIIGYTISFFTYHLDGVGVFMYDLHVSKEHRGNGIGVALWGELMKEALIIGGTHCLFLVEDYNTQSINFYQHKGATNKTQSKGIHFYKVDKDTMEKCMQAF